MSIRKSVLTTALVMSVSVVLADDVKFADYGTSSEKTANIMSTLNTLNDLNSAKYASLTDDQKLEIAKDYDLTVEEYSKYLKIKSSSFMGERYKNTDLYPEYYLANYYLIQGDKQKAEEYMAKYTQLEHDEVEREEELQRLWTKTAQEQFPNETPVKLKGPIPEGYETYGYQKHNGIIENVMNQINSNLLTANANYVLIENVDRDDKHVEALRDKLAKLANTKLDIYFLGNTTDAQIVAWAKKYNLGSLINQKKITINHAGKFVPELETQMKTKLQAGKLIKNNDGNYRIVDWSNVYAH